MSPQHSYDSSHRIKHMFFSSTTFSGGRHIFGFFSHSCRVSGITWPTAIYLSIHPSIHPSIYLSIYLACLSNCVSSYRPIYPSTYQSINLSIYLSISLSLQDPPNRGVGGTRALAHSILYICAILCNYYATISHIFDILI